MKPHPHLWFLLLSAALLISGCGRNVAGTSPAASPANEGADDQAEVASALAQAPEVVEDGAFETEDRWSTGSADALTAIHPVYWWRHIRESDRIFQFAFADTDTTGRPTRAVVTIHKRLRGSFNILAGERDEDDTRDSLDLIRKPLADHWVRRILLHRVRTDEGRLRWRVVASSGVEVTSKDATTQILSLRVQTATEDTTITDPLAFWFLRRLIRVLPEEPVTLTVTTGRNDDVVVLVSRAGRFRFHNNGDNTYTGTWRAPLLPGIRHVGVNALSHGTLFDDQAPYDSKAWILPYAVVGTEVAEFLPR